WRVNNMDQNPNTFGIANVGYNSSKSAVMEGYNNYNEDIDELISPALNLAFVNSAVMTFQYSAASRATSAAEANEALKVYYSANCGQTWTILGGGSMSGTNLSNFGYYNGYYVPSSASMWNTKTINLPVAACVQNVRFKFVYETGSASNNVYIDNINIAGAVGVEENLNSFALNVYPNPSNQMSTISYRLTDKSGVKLEIYDVLGKKVADLTNANQSEGSYSVEVSKADNNLKNGIYFIRLSVNNAVTTTKLVISE
ncbi:MAG: T9SS type A sorting domain-containing protein, partial [Bacteroidia bacterium]|nr:T9SS type A sorting domain-containing protein [Bacteroidia bacterium]